MIDTQDGTFKADSHDYCLLRVDIRNVDTLPFVSEEF